MMLQQSYVMPKTTPFQNYISNISTDPKSHMLGPYGPHQSFETMKTSPITATFLLHGSAWLHWIKVIPTIEGIIQAPRPNLALRMHMVIGMIYFDK